MLFYSCFSPKSYMVDINYQFFFGGGAGGGDGLTTSLGGGGFAFDFFSIIHFPLLLSFS